jgi:ADP-heptose:LPS heptosyltransferase
MKSILVVHQGAIGDFILSLSAVEAIHRFDLEAHFTFIAHPGIVEILRRRPYFKQVFDCSDRRWISLYSSEKALARAVHDLLPQVDSTFVFGRPASQIIADNLASHFGSPAHRLDPFPEPDLCLGVGDYQCRQLEKLGIPATPPPNAIIAPSRHNVLEARDFLSRNLGPSDRFVLLHPGSGGKQKLWAVAGWLSVIHKLSAHPNIRLALLQGPADAGIVQHLRSQLEFNSALLLENWQLGKLAALMSEVDLYLGNDSGITHLAAACGTPTIALFGPTDPQVWGPQGPQVSIIRWQPEDSFDKQAESKKFSEPPLEARVVYKKAREWLQI